MQEVEQKNNISSKPLWMISIGHALTHWYPATFYLILPLIGNELGLSYTEIGFLLTIQALISSIINIPGGMIADLVQRKGILMAIALFWVGVPYFIMGFSHSYWSILFCISVVGIGNMFWHPSAIPTLAYIYSRRKGWVLSLHGMGANAGDALAPLAIGTLLTWLTWREAVMLNVIPGMMMAIFITIALYDIKIADTQQDQQDEQIKITFKQRLKDYFAGLKQLFKNKNMIFLSSSSAFRAMAQNGLVVFIPLYLANELQLSMFWVGVSLSLMQAAGFIGAPLAGYFSDRLGRKSIILLSMVMMVAMLLVMLIFRNMILFIGGVALLGFFLYSIRPVLQAWLLETTPKEMGGTSISILFSVQSLGASIFPAIGGLIADLFGIVTVFYAIILVMVVANLFVFSLKEGVSQPEKNEGQA